MTREEEIKQEAVKVFPLPPLHNEEQRRSNEYAQSWARARDQQWGFQMGAKWADEHPMTYDGKEVLYVNMKSYDLGKKDTIEDICNWLTQHNDFIEIIDGCITRFNMDKCVEELKKEFKDNQ